MGDLSKLMTKERVNKIELYHYLITHEHKDIPAYNEMVDILTRDGKKFLEEVKKELSDGVDGDPC